MKNKILYVVIISLLMLLVTYRLSFAIFCIKCGNKNDNDSSFCVNCGNKIVGLDNKLTDQKSNQQNFANNIKNEAGKTSEIALPVNLNEKKETQVSTFGNNAPENRDFTKVVVNGVGIDNDRALKNALYNAIEQAVGLAVDAETIVKNETVVKDQILTSSNAYVEKYDIIYEGKRYDGLFEIKIKASVKKKALLEKLKQSNISTKNIDAKSIFGEILGKHENYQKAAVEFEKYFDGMPASLIDVELIDSKPKTNVANNSDIVEAVWQIKISYNRDKYFKDFAPKLEKFLDANSISKIDKTIFVQSEDDYIKYFIGSEIYYAVAWNALQLRPADVKRQILLDLNVFRNKIGDNIGWKEYIIDKESFGKVLLKIMSKTPRLRISFLDSNNNLINEDEFGIDKESKANSSNVILGNYRNFKVLFPEFVSNSWKTENYNLRTESAYSISPFFSFINDKTKVCFIDTIVSEVVVKFKMSEFKKISQVKVWLAE